MAQESKHQGRFARAALPAFIATTGPSAIPPPSAPFPFQLWGLPSFRSFHCGATRTSPVPQRALEIVPSLTPRRSGSGASAIRAGIHISSFGLRRVECGGSGDNVSSLAPAPARVAFAVTPRARPPRFGIFGATDAFAFATARSLAHPPEAGFVGRLRVFGYLPTHCPSYRTLALVLIGLLPPTEHNEY
jgi:hypothetical protein